VDIHKNPMLTPRHHQILKLLDQGGSQSLTALAGALGVSGETVRRDLAALQDRGLIQRSHGRAALTGDGGEAPFARRMREQAAEKRALAAALAATIRDGDAVMMDTGTTTSLLARALGDHRRLTIVTNSSDIARALATRNGNRVYMAGGELRPDSGAAFGRSAIDFVRPFAVTHAIVSAGAADTNGIMDQALEEAEFARTVLSCGERRIVATDATKFGRRGLVQVCGWAGVTHLATDRPPPDPIAAALQAASVALILPPAS